MNRLYKGALAILATLAVSAQNAVACAVCTGSIEADIAPAMNASMLFLLGAIMAVGSVFFGFLVYLARRDGLPLNDNQEISGDMTSPSPQRS